MAMSFHRTRIIILLLATTLVTLAAPVYASRAITGGDPFELGPVVIWDGANDIALSQGNGTTRTWAALNIADLERLAIYANSPDFRALSPIPPLVSVRILLRAQALATRCAAALPPAFCTRLTSFRLAVGAVQFDQSSFGYQLPMQPGTPMLTHDQIGALPTIPIDLVPGEAPGVWRLSGTERSVVAAVVAEFGAAAVVPWITSRKQAGYQSPFTLEIVNLAPVKPDVTNDGWLDLVWQNRTEGYLAAWTMTFPGSLLVSSDLFSPGRVSDPNWRVAATADMDGDGKLDLVWQEETQGWIGVWKMNGRSLVSSLAISIERIPDTDWKIVAAQDFNNDRKADIVWHHRTQGYVAIWYMDGVTVVASELFSPGRVADTSWRVEAAGDFNSDGKSDLLWRHQSLGYVVVWLMDGLSLMSSRSLTPERVADTNWRIAAVGDVNRDTKPDIVWQDVVNGWIGVWLMNGADLSRSTSFFPERVPDANWRIVGPK